MSGLSRRSALDCFRLSDELALTLDTMVNMRVFDYIEGPWTQQMSKEAEDAATIATLQLALARRDSAYMLVHPTPRHADMPNARQYTVINALVQLDPIPALSDEGRPQIWLKIGAGKPGEDGGENEDLLRKLVEGGVVRE